MVIIKKLTALFCSISVMARFFALFASFILLGYVFSGGAVAQNPFGSCDHVTSSAEAMQCLKNSKDEAQKKLNELFEDVAATLDSDQLAQFREAQKNWVSFRTRQCGLETALADDESLKTLYRLQCIEKLTRERLKHITGLQAWNSSDEPREFGNFPKWVNILERAHPEIVWDLKSAIKDDLTCNGRDERIIKGIDITHEPDTGELQGGTSLSIAIGFIHYEKNGKTEKTVRKFPIDTKRAAAETGERQNGTLCSAHVNLSIISQETAIRTDASSGKIPRRKPNRRCDNILKIDDGICQPLMLQYINGSYTLQRYGGQ